MKAKNHKKQLNTALEVRTQGVAQPDTEELTEEELQQVSGAGSRDGKKDIFWRN